MSSDPLERFLFPIAIAGLASIPALPTEWLQLGVAGLSLTILFWFITSTHPAILREERENNNKNIGRLLDQQNKATSQITDRMDEAADRQMRLMEKALGVDEGCDSEGER